MSAVSTILHPTDFSEHSDFAFQLACSLTRNYGARLVIVHVAMPPVVIYDEKGLLLPHLKDYRESAKEKLSQLCSPDDKVLVEHRLEEEGEVASIILRVAAETKANLIVMGTLGRTGLDRLLFGSVAREVMRKAPCPVLTVRVPKCHQATYHGHMTSAAVTGFT